MSPPSSHVWLRWAEGFVCLALGAALSIAAGQDANWDLRNYHLYNPISILDSREGLDFFPADKHSGLNPLLDFIYAYLGRGPFAYFPRLLAGVMGLWYGLLIVVSLHLVRLFFEPTSQLQKYILVPLITLTSVTGAMTRSQIGTTSNDVSIAMLVLLGLFLVLAALQKKEYTAAHFIGGGLLLGFAGGAKLTAVIYMPALVGALLIVWPLKESITIVAPLSFGWIAGFMGAFGWWGAKMWRQYANPVFPMLNGIFKSPLAPQVNLTDTRFFPRDDIQWMAYPFFWAWDKTSHLVYETDFRDPRMALAYTALIISGIAIFWHAGRYSSVSGVLFTRVQKIILLFFFFSYLSWLLTTSILRYAIVLEVMSVPVFLITMMALIKKRHARVCMVVAACLLCLLTTRSPDWGHTSFRDKVFDVDMSWAEANTLFLGVYEPVAYLAACVAPSQHAQFAGLGFITYLKGWPLGDKGQDMIRNHKGPIVVLFREERRPFLQILKTVGLSPDVKACRMIKTNLAPDDSPALWACYAETEN